jgi:hypothetical protein
MYDIHFVNGYAPIGSPLVAQANFEPETRIELFVVRENINPFQTANQTGPSYSDLWTNYTVNGHLRHRVSTSVFPTGTGTSARNSYSGYTDPLKQLSIIRHYKWTYHNGFVNNAALTNGNLTQALPSSTTSWQYPVCSRQNRHGHIMIRFKRPYRVIYDSDSTGNALATRGNLYLVWSSNSNAQFTMVPAVVQFMVRVVQPTMY